MSLVGFCPMHLEEGTKQLLEQYYNLDAGDLSPVKRPKSKWKHDNKFGFLLGLVEHGRERDKRHLHEMLAQNEFSRHEHHVIPLLRHQNCLEALCRKGLNLFVLLGGF